MEAPERIWATPEHEDEGYRYGSFWTAYHDAAGSAVEYVRADLSPFPAGMRAGLEAAADYHDRHASGYRQVGNRVDAAAHKQHSAAIRAIPVPQGDPVAELVTAARDAEQRIVALYAGIAPHSQGRMADQDDAVQALRAALAKMEGRG